MIEWLMGKRRWRWLAAIVGFAAMLLRDRGIHRKGRKDERRDQRVGDLERAEDMRRKADVARAGGGGDDDEQLRGYGRLRD
ncbi:hypothetical protein ACVDG3_08665 [Meridianimarinicoccus sp. RP-17]|uniref:hypothetical protein n=1 Tax=Meridianimarinicoccus zhengii TaxID=2056810 RepID=UPI000DAEBD60|nr:hypothetical protein [Phycocomes zhengii]